MSRSDGVLRVVLTGKWFDMIESGEKMEEYRRDKPGKDTWVTKLLSDGTWEDPDGGQLPKFRELGERIASESTTTYDFHPYHTLVASRGYTARTLTRKIKRIRWGKPRPEWSGDTVTGDCFVIELEAA
jgi:hypothetical protein